MSAIGPAMLEHRTNVVMHPWLQHYFQPRNLQYAFTLILIHTACMTHWHILMYCIKHTWCIKWCLSFFEQPLWSPELIPDISSETSSMGSAHCTFCKATVPNNLMYSHLNSHFQDKAGDWQSQTQELSTSRCLALFMALLPVLYAQWARHTATFHSEGGGREGLHAHLFKL